MMQIKNKFIPSIIIASLAVLIVSCSSVFSAGVSGRVVDAESTNTPKDGIADVNVYVYIDEKVRNDDFNSWTAGTRFSPATSEHYIGQTSTSNDGSFTINRVVWESKSPHFGKTADFTTVYLLFFHENFGLAKNNNNAIIMSDSTSNVIYQEMTGIRKQTSLEIQILNAANDATLNIPINTIIQVPQLKDFIEYEVSITGTSSVLISYPRYASDGKTVFIPEINISYSQLGSDIDYKACHYNTEKDNYTFMESPKIAKKVTGSTYPVKLYMKTLTHSLSNMSGQINYGVPAPDSLDEGTKDDDNVIIMLAYKVGEKIIPYSESSAKVRTSSTGDGANSSRIRHGLFSGLGNGITWKNASYDGRYDTQTVYIVVDKDGDEKISLGDFYYTKTLRSDEGTVNFGIINKASHELITSGHL